MAYQRASTTIVLSKSFLTFFGIIQALITSDKDVEFVPGSDNAARPFFKFAEVPEAAAERRAAEVAAAAAPAAAGPSGLRIHTRDSLVGDGELVEECVDRVLQEKQNGPNHLQYVKTQFHSFPEQRSKKVWKQSFRNHLVATKEMDSWKCRKGSFCYLLT